MGLLDNLTDPQSLAVLNLAGGLLSPGSFGQGLQRGMQGYQSTLMNAQDMKFKQAQLEDVTQQAQLRKIQADRQARILDYVGQWMNQPGQEFQAGQTALNAAKSTGLPAGPTMTAAGAIPFASQLVRQSLPFGNVPREAITADLAFNEGKGLGEMLYKQGIPQIEFVNGVAVDKNRVQPGYSVPTVSQNGQASQLVPDANAPGGWRVLAPAGAVDTYSGYRTAEERAKAEMDPIKVYDPITRRDYYMPRSRVVGGAQQPTPSIGLSAPRLPDGGAQAAADAASSDVAGRVAAIQEDIKSLNAVAFDPKASPEQRKAAVDGIRANQNEIARVQNESANAKLRAPRAPGYAAGPSSQEKAQEEYDREAQKDYAARRASIYSAGDAAQARVADFQRLGELLRAHDGGNLSPRGLDIAKTANSMGLKIDPQLGNKEAAAALANRLALELRNPSGGAGMPGSLSDQDRKYLASMVPGLATSAEGRGQILNYVIALEQRKQQVADFARKYEDVHGRLDNSFFGQLQAWAKDHPVTPRARSATPAASAAGSPRSAMAPEGSW